MLYDAGCHFAAYLKYDAATAENICSGMLKKWAGGLNTSYMILLADEGTDISAQRQVYEYVKTYRCSRKVQTVLIDMYSDMQYIDNMMAGADPGKKAPAHSVLVG